MTTGEGRPEAPYLALGQRLGLMSATGERPRPEALYLALGQCLGLLSDERVFSALVATLQDPDGLRPSYVSGLRDQLTRALSESGHEP